MAGRKRTNSGSANGNHGWNTRSPRLADQGPRNKGYGRSRSKGGLGHGRGSGGVGRGQPGYQQWDMPWRKRRS